MNPPGQTIARYFPLLLGFILLIYLLVVRFNWIPVELLPSPENKETVLSPAECSLSLSSSPGGEEGLRTFSPGGKIYARVQLQKVTPGKHTVSFYWINPRGGVEEIYDQDFSPRGGSYHCWSWLKLKGADWFPVSIGSFGPAGFRGHWGVRVYLDEKMLAQREFVVK